ncbi:polysaccharide deacetylase family protein [Winogradskyella immobilis]|uniref:Polysaccharide deacetylase family protein n=1 Tax=Winogradskyella immobilis TaxID=2816852 RepID=A0ABS8EKZ8_9FLAO|nr:polysaccharide deacetylase family protein [Winogradskyella immobilis]MCC1482982.1 polysaccharide deacetylase family protein [Winogradskyella immobilis]MCG0015077.1 polysaccharide deacetylase family protein [Winogradskyella immobilis]
MQLIPAKTPGFVKSIFPNFIWDIETSQQELYLTFDDGPAPEITDWVLELLKAYNAKATFFCIGDNIEKHPQIFKNIIENDHSIGNHTYNHLKGWKHKTKDYINDVEITQRVIEQHLSTSINRKNFFRPPYGKFKSKQAKKLQKQGYKIVLWDVLSFDWDASISQEKCLDNVLNSTKNGSIIVFHDSVKAEQHLKYVLPKVLEYYTKKGYVFKSLKNL